MSITIWLDAAMIVICAAWARLAEVRGADVAIVAVFALISFGLLDFSGGIAMAAGALILAAALHRRRTITMRGTDPP